MNIVPHKPKLKKIDHDDGLRRQLDAFGVKVEMGSRHVLDRPLKDVAALFDQAKQAYKRMMVAFAPRMLGDNDEAAKRLNGIWNSVEQKFKHRMTTPLWVPKGGRPSELAMMIKTCAWMGCRREFDTTVPSKKYCCKSCRLKIKVYRHRESGVDIATGKPRKDQGHTYNRECKCCQKPFTTTRQNRKHCSEECAKKTRAVETMIYYRNKLRSIGRVIPEGCNYFQFSKNCATCGCDFKTRKVNQKTCSDQCSEKHTKLVNADYKRRTRKRIFALQPVAIAA